MEEAAAAYLSTRSQEDASVLFACTYKALLHNVRTLTRQAFEVSHTDRQDAEQYAFMRLWEVLLEGKAPEAPEEFQRWAYGCLANFLRRFKRTTERSQRVGGKKPVSLERDFVAPAMPDEADEFEELEDPAGHAFFANGQFSAPAEAELEAAELAASIEKSLSRLSELHRHLFDSVLVGGMTQVGFSMETGTPLRTVKRKYAELRDVLRETLGEDAIEVVALTPEERDKRPSYDEWLEERRAAFKRRERAIGMRLARMKQARELAARAGERSVEKSSVRNDFPMETDNE